MINRVTKIITVFAIIIITTGNVFADGTEPPPPNKKTGNFSKGSFSKKSAWSNNGKGISPPPPDGGGTGGGEMGNPIPSGMAFLLLGSFLYFTKRVRDENE